MKTYIGVDIGGTKCAVTLGSLDPSGLPTILAKEKYDTKGTPEQMLAILCDGIRRIMGSHKPLGIGVSCGGPLNSREGRILSPPNLPGWDDVPIKAVFEQAFSIPCRLQNDADACALAEWKFGAGRGTENMVFLTCGTGFGAGLILNGRLYTGSRDMAGEIGHIRAADHGPVGYGKAGSYEGFCSGGGIAQVAATLALERLQMGQSCAYCPDRAALEQINAKLVAEAAFAKDPTALEVFECCGQYLGRSLALLIDLLNPQAIVLGSIYARCEALLAPICARVIQKECLSPAAKCCAILPAQLGEAIGDMAALAVAAQAE